MSDEANHGGEGSEQEEAIDCLVWWGITLGKADGSYAPNERNSREQMASFILRKLQLVTGFTTPAGTNKFANEPISAVHRQAVEAIAATNPPITVGYSDGRFRALREISREEMATFIVRQLRVAGATVPAASGPQFPDVDPNSPHADNIRILRQMGIVQGRADGTYGPKDIVNRGNMSIFLSRDIAELVSQGRIPPKGTAASVTSRPELVSATVVSTVTTGVLQGTTIEYVFDETVTRTGAGALSNFIAVLNDGTRFNNASSATVVSGTPSRVRVLFPTINSQAIAGNLTLATVRFNAVRDAQGEENPEGDTGLGTASPTPLPAGQTNAADLTGVRNFRAVGTTQTFVDFVFDAAANNNIANGYNLVTTTGFGAGAQVNCAFDSGNGTTTHTVVCPNPVGQTLNPANFSRGWVAQNTVMTLTSPVGNPKQAADVEGGDPATGTADLTGATINRDAAPGGVAVDQATLVFDQPVATGPNFATGFRSYGVAGAGSEQTPNAVGGIPAVQFSSTTPNQVLLTFTDGELSTAVGFSVDTGAVIVASGSNVGQQNQDDEEGAANTTSATTAGQTTRPELTGVTRSPAVDIFGNPTGGFNITYMYDEDVTGAVIGGHLAYLPDGTQLTCTTGAIGTTEATDDRFTCTGWNDPRLGPAANNATNSTVQSAALGAVTSPAVNEETGGRANNEGAAPIANA